VQPRLLHKRGALAPRSIYLQLLTGNLMHPTDMAPSPIQSSRETKIGLTLAQSYRNPRRVTTSSDHLHRPYKSWYLPPGVPPTLVNILLTVIVAGQMSFPRLRRVGGTLLAEMLCRPPRKEKGLCFQRRGLKPRNWGMCVIDISHINLDVNQFYIDG